METFCLSVQTLLPTSQTRERPRGAYGWVGGCERGNKAQGLVQPVCTWTNTEKAPGMRAGSKHSEGKWQPVTHIRNNCGENTHAKLAKSHQRHMCPSVCCQNEPNRLVRLGPTSSNSSSGTEPRPAVHTTLKENKTKEKNGALRRHLAVPSLLMSSNQHLLLCKLFMATYLHRSQDVCTKGLVGQCLKDLQRWAIALRSCFLFTKLPALTCFSGSLTLLLLNWSFNCKNACREETQSVPSQV